MMKSILFPAIFLIVVACASPDMVFIDAEAFDTHGGWVTDQQGMDVRGSSCLLAHGAGIPVEYAVTTVSLMEQGIGEQGLPNDQDFCIHGCFDPNISPK